ncbi:hypothetical protein [Roseivirga pacifica]|uniref:hypothetical protein n=1 Tax=Roseivirga pacifica TaxID=1267423 RepID=UPI002094AC71|nr:hypothetical protein [Roseivirga pacifica]MCO6360969.1 hypothetical protein [Roseivirga pacifica]MCO6368858.1 hypothetical protein [Roseivirga pacifica]MCO6373002.1 hypothetical protein [Roseivirga pacifica]MCO6377062.1 hypothetical protein [Roseivirga pacifica]MCO6377661.1 hypothetical protein [Roseivirga pacifica]
MKSEFQASIFIPSNTTDWKPNSSKMLFGGIVLLIAFGGANYFLDINTLLGIIIAFVLWLIGAIWGLSERQIPNGAFKGQLFISEDSIKINQKTYTWTEVNNFSFKLLHFLGQELHSSTIEYFRFPTGGPAYSAGIDNYIYFTSRNETNKVFFRIESPKHKIDFSTLIKELYLKDLISLEKAYNGLNLSYEEIQQLKKLKVEVKKQIST